jgi:hypothetical protein
MAIALSMRSLAAGRAASRANCCSWQSPLFHPGPQEVCVVWQRNQQVRRIYLNREHIESPQPSWFGESIGRYKNGELVVDTIGFVEHPYSFVDNYRTPRTRALHVVERWKMFGGGNAIEATVMVEDPGAFDAPWWGNRLFACSEEHAVKSMLYA